MKPILFYLTIFTAMGLLQSCLDSRPAEFIHNEIGNYSDDVTSTEMLYDFSENEIFDSFIQKFSRDSLFQISRVQFPLPLAILEENNVKAESFILERNWSRIVVEENETTEVRYFQTRERGKEVGILEVKDLGVNKISTYFFELKNGGWFLVRTEKKSIASQ